MAYNNKEKEKIKMLVEVSKMYYLESMNQADIARKINVSRPLISKYLNDAKAMGIVNVQINNPLEEEKDLEYVFNEKFKIKATIIPYSINDDITNQLLADKLGDVFTNDVQVYKNIGIGWGSTIGKMALGLEPKLQDTNTVITPLLGNATSSNRYYHTNELVRMIAEKLNFSLNFLYAPVICDSEEEKNNYINSFAYKNILKSWEKLDVAVITIRNHPSVPDMGSIVRFGNQLKKEKAVGLALGYYYNLDGKFIQSPNDHVIQCPLDLVKNTKIVIGIASSRVSQDALIGAINSKLFTHIILDSNNANLLL